MSKRKIREIFLFKDYFSNFYKIQNQKVKEKIIWTLKLIEEIEYVPEDYLKHLEGTKGLYEIRIKHGSNNFRILCFFDKGKLIVLANAFQKKSQKSPKSEILKAYKIRELYEKEK